jgi:hypothetical protein
MRVLVCGGRTFSQYSLLSRTLDEFHKLNKITELCHGGARGADTLAGAWAMARRIPVKVYRADWTKHGRSAGPIRNVTMFRDFKPDTVFAFPGGTGTQHMKQVAHVGGIPIISVNYDQ